MAYEIPGQTVPMTAAADLSSKQFYVVYGSAANSVNVATDNTAHVPLGILQNEPESGQAAAVCINGVSKAVAGDAVSAGALLTFDSEGRVVTASGTGIYTVGVALQAASAAGEVIPVLIRVFKI